jgi:hypothetical protein
MKTRRVCFALLLCALPLAGCSKPEQPKPDGSSGIKGVCLLPAEPPDADGKVPDRKRWPGLEISAMLVNSPAADFKTKFRTTANPDGTFQLALNPGEYTIGVYDRALLHNKVLSPMLVKVEPGGFTEIVIDYDKLNVRDLPKR